MAFFGGQKDLSTANFGLPSVWVQRTQMPTWRQPAGSEQGPVRWVDVDKFDLYCFLDESIFVSVLVLHLRSAKVWSVSRGANVCEVGDPLLHCVTSLSGREWKAACFQTFFQYLSAFRICSRIRHFHAFCSIFFASMSWEVSLRYLRIVEKSGYQAHLQTSRYQMLKRDGSQRQQRQQCVLFDDRANCCWFPPGVKVWIKN